MRKTYILDTSALITNPFIYKTFQHSDIIIPIIVINELDRKKTSFNEAGKNARVCIRGLDEISNLGDISTGILLDNDILIKIDTTFRDTKSDLYKDLGDSGSADTAILACANSYYLMDPNSDVTLVSNDLNLRIRARSKGIDAVGYEEDKRSFDDLYSGAISVVNPDLGEKLLSNGYLSIDDCEGFSLFPNECISFLDENNSIISIGRKVSEDKIKLLKKTYPWNISSRNKEQSFAIDMIMDKNIDLVTLVGFAGTGKTIIAMAAALELVINKKDYNKLVIYRPVIAVDEGIGWLPGTLEEKMQPWMQPIIDNLEVILEPGMGDKWKVNLDLFKRKGILEFDAISYIRGRSITNAIILVDEIQNLSTQQVKTILTRAGDGTKIILTGDIEQIDNKSLDAMNNGLAYVVEKFKKSDLSGHITFTEGERSRLATYAAKVMR